MLHEDRYGSPGFVLFGKQLTLSSCCHTDFRTRCFLPETRGLVPAPFKTHSFLWGKCVAPSEACTRTFVNTFFLKAKVLRKSGQLFWGVVAQPMLHGTYLTVSHTGRKKLPS